MINVVDNLRTYLLAESTVTALVSTRIYAGFAPQGDAMPYVTIVQIAGAPAYHLTGADTTRDTLIQVDCYATSQTAANTLANAIENTVVAPQTVGTLRVGGWMCSSDRETWERPTDNSDRWIARISRDYQLTTSQPATTG